MQGVLGAFHRARLGRRRHRRSQEGAARRHHGVHADAAPRIRARDAARAEQGPAASRSSSVSLGVTFGYWIPIWISDYWPLVVGGKAIASWVPFTILGFEVMVLVGGLATVFAMFGFAGIPRLTMTVGYDARFSARPLRRLGCDRARRGGSGDERPQEAWSGGGSS